MKMRATKGSAPVAARGVASADHDGSAVGVHSSANGPSRARTIVAAVAPSRMKITTAISLDYEELVDFFLNFPDANRGKPVPRKMARRLASSYIKAAAVLNKAAVGVVVRLAIAAVDQHAD